MHVLAITNQKGGVGKTTSAVNLASIFGLDHKRRTLLIDLDPQGHASEHVNQRINKKPPVYQVLVDGASLLDVRVTTMYGFDLIIGGNDTAIAEMHLMASQNVMALAEALEGLEQHYDVVILDCPPSLGQLLICALLAATDIVVPMPLQFLPVDGFSTLLNRIERARRMNPKLRLAAVFPTNSNERTTLAKLIRNDLAEKCGDAFIPDAIRINVALAEASAAKKPVTHHAPDSPGAEDYRTLASALIQKGVA